MTQLTLKKDDKVTIVSLGPLKLDAKLLETAIKTSPVVSITKEMPRHTYRFEGVPEDWAMKFKRSAFIKYEGKLIPIVLVGSMRAEYAQDVHLLSNFAMKKCRYVSPEELETLRRENEAAERDARREYQNSWTPRENKPRTYDRSDRTSKFQSTRFSGGKPGGR